MSQAAAAPPAVLSGVKVSVHASVPHRKAKMKLWRHTLTRLGAELVEDSPSQSFTHLLVGPAADVSDINGKMPQAMIVYVDWLEACLATQHRVAEEEYICTVKGKESEDSLMSVREQGSINLNDVQQALLWATIDAPAPVWLNAQSKSPASTVVLVMMPGLDEQRFAEYKERQKSNNVETYFGAPILLRPLHGAVHPLQSSRALCTIDAQTAATFKKRKRADEDQIISPNSHSSHGNTSNTKPLDGPIAADADGDNRASTSEHPLGRYQASLAQMQAAVYPLPLKGADGQDVLPTGFVASHLTGEPNSSKHQRVVAIDCEMCYTRKALVVARITLVDEDERVLMDELVLPDEPILNYNTAYSGITAAMMQGATKTLAQIQQQMLQYVGPETLLVGHSLENDLKVLQLVHLRNLDTAMMYPHARWSTSQHSLRSLAETYLGWTIQTGSHDSKQDAVASLRLAKLKLQRGSFFGTTTVAGRQNLLSMLHDHDRKCCMLDRPDVLAWLADPSCDTQACETDQATVEAACQQLQQGTANFVWLQLWALSALQEARGYGRLAKQKYEYPEGAESHEQGSLLQCVSHFDVQLGHVWNALQPGSLLLVVTGQGDTTPQRHQEEAAKDLRHARQLASATHGKHVAGPKKVRGKRAEPDVPKALCFCMTK